MSKKEKEAGQDSPLEPSSSGRLLNAARGNSRVRLPVPLTGGFAMRPEPGERPERGYEQSGWRHGVLGRFVYRKEDKHYGATDSARHLAAFRLAKLRPLHLPFRAACHQECTRVIDFRSQAERAGSVAHLKAAGPTSPVRPLARRAPTR